MNSIQKLRDEFAVHYSGLNGKYEGYIQMSDQRIKHLFTKATPLPPLDEIYKDHKNNATDVNYVLEMALFEPSTKNSILIRQHNADWLVLKESLSGNEPMDSFHTVTANTPKMKIAQIWESKANEFCNSWNVLEPKALMFAGFEGDKND